MRCAGFTCIIVHSYVFNFILSVVFVHSQQLLIFVFVCV
jgi:hypothetical protein